MRRRLAVLALASFALLGAERPRGLADVTAVRHWSYPDYTRIVIETTAPVRPKGAVQKLQADRKAKRPARLYVDLDGLWVGRRYLEGLAVGDGLLQGVRLGQNTLRATRVVLDLERYARHRLIELSHPHRIVIDVYGRRKAPEQDLRLAPSLRPVRTVVLDPGHGGRDPGAVGVKRLREKEVTLRLARALGPKLEARGFNVVYTREEDRTLSLEERTAIAEAAGGDLFVSLHANASRRRSARGIETYYPDANHTRHTLRVAARENGIRSDRLDALQTTLARLRRSAELSPHSQRLAELVHGQLVGGLPRSYGSVEDLGVKKGPFYVLFLSDMPAILVEIGFLTNKREARRLRDGDYLTAVAEHISVGLSQYRKVGTTLARSAFP